MNKTIYIKIISILFPIIMFSCDDDDDASCNDPMQIIDDCGICRDNEESEDWNATMDECGICNGNNSACSGCMDEIAFTYDDSAQFHNCEDCIYDYVSLYIIDDGSISLEVDEEVTMYPGNIIVIKTNQKIGLVNQLDDNIIFSLDACINSAKSCNDSCLEYDSSICEFYNECEWNEDLNNCASTIDLCSPITNENDCNLNSDCYWPTDFYISQYINTPYLQDFKYEESYNFSITIPWIDYTINGSVIVNDYEN